MIISPRSKRTPSGGRYRKYRKKRLYDSVSMPVLTKIGKTRRTGLRTKGRNIKIKSLSAENANVYDPKTKKYAIARIKTVSESNADRHYVRRNILVRGSVIETELGKAKITSRPGQEGTINAVLI